MTEDNDDIELDDDELERAAGGIILNKDPGGHSPNYSYNSTIYFQASITDTVT
ncbi:MAG: hypothetical protein RL720_526 [Actinomycetota bacterium]|jgi:hypothetical protein